MASLALVAVEMRLDGAGETQRVLGQKGVHDGLRVGAVLGGDGDLHAVAGGEDQRLGHAVARLEVGAAASGSAASGKASRSRTSTGAVLWLTPVTSSFIVCQQHGAQPRVRGPGERGQPSAHRHDGGFAPAPAGRDAENTMAR